MTKYTQNTNRSVSKPSGQRYAGLKPWKQGQSGNPGGRPRVARELQELSRGHSVEAIEKIYGLMQSDDESVALAACKLMIERGYGKPLQDDPKVEEVEKRKSSFDWRKLSRAKMEILAKILKGEPIVIEGTGRVIE